MLKFEEVILEAEVSRENASSSSLILRSISSSDTDRSSQTVFSFVCLVTFVQKKGLSRFPDSLGGRTGGNGPGRLPGGGGGGGGIEPKGGGGGAGGGAKKFAGGGGGGGGGGPG